MTRSLQSGVQIRLAQESDLPQLRAISEAASSSAHWTQQQWLAVFHTPTPARVAWIAEGGISAQGGLPGIGLLAAKNGGPEWELENIAVLPAFRRQGVGFHLLSALLRRADSLLAEKIFLEVRATNQSAIRLYTESGFRLVARRPEYYQNPIEDALILVHLF